MIGTNGNGFLELEPAELEFLLANGEFSINIRNRAEKTVVIMTQDWCPQWDAMKDYLPEFFADADIYVLLYNRHPLFDRILDFKENRFKSMTIPYVRFYSGGNLVSASGYLSRAAFAAALSEASISG